jgi:hypothetical protein
MGVDSLWISIRVFTDLNSDTAGIAFAIPRMPSYLSLWDDQESHVIINDPMRDSLRLFKVTLMSQRIGSVGRVGCVVDGDILHVTLNPSTVQR